MSWLLTAAFLVHAFNPLAPPVTAPIEGATVGAIVIDGERRTREWVIRRELTQEVGKPFESKRWRDDVQRVRDLSILWYASTTAETRQGKVILYLNVEEKWTLIPAFGFATSPDVLEWNLGLYEANLFGLNTELGFQYLRKRAGNGYQLWHYNQRVGASPFYYQLEAYRLNRQHVVYDQGAPENLEVGRYEALSNSLVLEVGTRLDADGRQRVGLIYSPSEIENRLPDDAAGSGDFERIEGFLPPPSRFLHKLGLRVQWGLPRYDDYIYEGWGTEINATIAFRELLERRAYTGLSINYRRLYKLFGRHNAGFRLFAGSVDSTALDDVFSMGGLAEVRGLPDERFLGQRMWLMNGEYRYPVLDSRWLLGQLAAFVDAGNTWNGAIVSTDAYRHSAVSVGGGTRILIKPLFATFLRVDYGVVLYPYRTQGVSLGIRQFF